MSGERWIVRDRVLHDRNGNGVWAHSLTRAGAELLRAKIVMGRYRGSRPRAWARSTFYTPPPFGQLIVTRFAAAGGASTDKAHP
jgi:hypothetical protein